MKVIMRRPGLSLAMGAIIGVTTISGCVMGPRRYQSELDHGRSPDWANLSLTLMIEKYGPPDRIESKRVVWENKSPWKRIAVWDEMDYSQISESTDNIEQTLAYLVPEARRKDVEDYNRRLKVTNQVAELSARSSSEERNYLALNLADEIVRGLRSPEEAKIFYDVTIRQADAGKTSPYMLGLRFKKSPIAP